MIVSPFADDVSLSVRLVPALVSGRPPVFF